MLPPGQIQFCKQEMYSLFIASGYLIQRDIFKPYGSPEGKPVIM